MVKLKLSGEFDYVLLNLAESQDIKQEVYETI